MRIFEEYLFSGAIGNLLAASKYNNDGLAVKTGKGRRERRAVASSHEHNRRCAGCGGGAQVPTRTNRSSLGKASHGGDGRQVHLSMLWTFSAERTGRTHFMRVCWCGEDANRSGDLG